MSSTHGTVFDKKRIEELNLVYFIQIGATVTSKSLLKVKTQRCTNNTFWTH